MELKHNVVGWFELPVSDMERAVKFYESVFGFKLRRQEMGELYMAMFPNVEDSFGTSGSLVKNEEYIPSADGILIYFTTPSGDLVKDLEVVKKSGGTILLEKTLISKEIGYMAMFLDTEGNRIALHSR
ncbi:MAG: VOC family protein [Syntrophothermus sp.]